jgi:hypothetical protein
MQHSLKTIAFATAALAVAPLAASAQPYGGFHGGPAMGFHHNGSMEVTARISSIQGSSITLDNGRTVFLNHTQVNGRLHRGARIDVVGTRAGDHNINAQTITVIRR